MVVNELFERAVVVVKTVWRKRGDSLTCHEVEHSTKPPAVETKDGS